VLICGGSLLGGGHQPFEKGVEAWVNEKPNYHGEKIAEGDLKAYGHYTQVCFILGEGGFLGRRGMQWEKGGNGE